jgi:hypothetical protein
MDTAHPQTKFRFTDLPMISIYIDPPAPTGCIQREANRSNSSRPLLQMNHNNTRCGRISIPLFTNAKSNQERGQEREQGRGHGRGHGRTKVLAEVGTKGHHETFDASKSSDQPKPSAESDEDQMSPSGESDDDDDETDMEACARESRHRVNQAALCRDTRFGWRNSRLGWNV